MAETSKKTPASIQEDRWRSGRTRFGLLQFRRDRASKTWHFSGQQPDEEVRLVVRKHWWFLVIHAWPVAASLLALIISCFCAITLPSMGSLWILCIIVFALALFGSGGWFAYKYVLDWWYETNIITNKRIITARGLFEPTRQQTTIDRVQQVGLDVAALRGLILGYGTVHVYLVGGDFFIRDVPSPRKVRDAILGVSDSFRASKKTVDEPKTQNPDLAEVLDALAKEKPVPQLPDIDEHLPAPRNAARFRGPRRTFGGILRIPCDVRYMSGEYTVKYIQRSQYVLWRNQSVPFLLLLITIPVALIGSFSGFVPPYLQSWWWFFMGLIMIACLVALGLMYANYVDDVYILTNRRIIDIQRYFIFFSERRLEAEYKNIRDIRVKVPNVVERFLDIGNVYVETPGNSPDITLESVDHPFVLQDEILGIKTHKEREDAARKENTEKKNLRKWFDTVVSKLEETTMTRGAPNLREMDLLTAMACAQEYGFDVTVRGEAIDNPLIPPGHVVHQNPPSGTIMEKGSKIEVVLSKRPLLVD